MIVKMACSTNNLLIKDLDTTYMIFKFTSKYEYFEKDFLTEGVLKAIGQVSVESYKNNSYFLAETNFQSEKENELTKNDTSLLGVNIQAYYAYLQNFIQYLWFVKDNCCGINSFHAFMPEAKRTIIKTNPNAYSTCSGSLTDQIEFTIAELDKVAKIYVHCNNILPNKILKKLQPGEVKPDDILPRKINPIDYKNTNRVQRAMHFLNMARSTNILPAKIALYMCVYECLFSGTDKVEIIHQIAERTALYLGSYIDSRFSIYDLIKEGYGVRSSYYHGKRIKENRDKLLEISKRIDALTRALFSKVFFDDYKVFTQENESILQLSFKELLFRDRESSVLSVTVGESKPEYLLFSDGGGGGFF
ncbi:MAG: HEPN domain-containing protein [Ferruginibacter sp.]